MKVVSFWAHYSIKKSSINVVSQKLVKLCDLFLVEISFLFINLWSTWCWMFASLSPPCLVWLCLAGFVWPAIKSSLTRCLTMWFLSSSFSTASLLPWRGPESTPPALWVMLPHTHSHTQACHSNQNQNQNQNQLYSPSVCKHTRNLLWFLRSSWYIHAYIHTYI